MRGEWCYFKNFLNKEECDELIKSIKKEDSIINKLIDRTDNRKANIFWLDMEKYKNLYNKSWIAAIEANREFFGFHIDTIKSLQIIEYKKTFKGFIAKHVDNCWISDEDNKQIKLNCVIQLTEKNKYSGCELKLHSFSPLNESEISDQGTAIFFPSFLPHEVSPITKGTRYSMVISFAGPSFT